MPDPIISPEARADLNSIWDYLAQRDVEAADRFLDELLIAARRHVSFPRTGRPRDDLRPGLRSFVVAKHIVFFVPHADTIHIVRVLHGARDVDQILSDGAG